ncbi:hypothetical protein IH992_14710 [Candidatus Poribacteria bacterium]|nr:hypothetical protein [Candidatus Poribacteria bacterium]
MAVGRWESIPIDGNELERVDKSFADGERYRQELKKMVSYLVEVTWHQQASIMAHRLGINRPL